MLFTPEGHNADMMMLGIEWLKEGIRVEKVLSEKLKENDKIIKDLENKNKKLKELLKTEQGEINRLEKLIKENKKLEEKILNDLHE